MPDHDRGTTLESLPGAVIALDRDAEVVAANDSSAVVTGLPVEGLEGATLGALADRGIFDEAVERRYLEALSTLEGDDAESASFPVAIRLGGDGPARTFEAQVSLRPDDGDGRAVCALSAVGTSDRYDETTEALHDATRRLMAAETTGEAFEVCGRAAHDVLGFEGTGVREYDADAGLLRHVSFGGRVENIDERPPFPVDDSPHGEAFRTEETVVETIPESDDPLGREAFSQAMYVPIGDHGVLSCGTMTGTFDDADVRFAEILAENTAAALTAIEQRERLREQRRELERRNERLDEFASIVAHDLENPLALASGALDAYRDAGDEAFLRKAAGAIDRMDTIVSEVLALARSGGAVEDPDTVDLEHAAARAWSSLETGDADLAVDASAPVVADRDRLLRLLENLLANAVDHGGAATVRVSGDEDGFVVADDGTGLPDGDVFEPNYTTAEDGTGFGLAIVEDIAQAHDWTVTAGESDRGGARFAVEGVTTGER
jgi:signal transduction histidine kinase